MMEEMRLHYTNTHDQWCKRIDFEQILRCYTINCYVKFVTEIESTELNMNRVGMEWCKILPCQFVCTKHEEMSQHLKNHHNTDWNTEQDMNPFWK